MGSGQFILLVMSISTGPMCFAKCFNEASKIIAVLCTQLSNKKHKIQFCHYQIQWEYTWKTTMFTSSISCGGSEHLSQGSKIREGGFFKVARHPFSKFPDLWQTCYWSFKVLFRTTGHGHATYHPRSIKHNQKIPQGSSESKVIFINYNIHQFQKLKISIQKAKNCLPTLP